MVTTIVAPTTEARAADIVATDAVTVVRAHKVGSGDPQVHEQFLAIIAANYPDWAASTAAGVTAGQRERRDPDRPSCVLAATTPGPPAGPGRCVIPGRVGTIRQQQHQPHQRSPPRLHAVRTRTTSTSR